MAERAHFFTGRKARVPRPYRYGSPSHLADALREFRPDISFNDETVRKWLKEMAIPEGPRLGALADLFNVDAGALKQGRIVWRRDSAEYKKLGREESEPLELSDGSRATASRERMILENYDALEPKVQESINLIIEELAKQKRPD